MRTNFQTKWMPKVGTGMEKSAEMQQVTEDVMD